MEKEEDKSVLRSVASFALHRGAQFGIRRVELLRALVDKVDAGQCRPATNPLHLRENRTRSAARAGCPGMHCSLHRRIRPFHQCFAPSSGGRMRTGVRAEGDYSGAIRADSKTADLFRKRKEKRREEESGAARKWLHERPNFFVCAKGTDHSMPLPSLAALGGSPEPGHLSTAVRHGGYPELGQAQRAPTPRQRGRRRRQRRAGVGRCLAATTQDCGQPAKESREEPANYGG
ncbi:hypothetical protein C8R44DRAFT_752357 [Mycena epipterygia]|nr:hypothetical protein C8R44DRAFT_752357 [Mycena epipterygia]